MKIYLLLATLFVMVSCQLKNDGVHNLSQSETSTFSESATIDPELPKFPKKVPPRECQQILDKCYVRYPGNTETPKGAPFLIGNLSKNKGGFWKWAAQSYVFKDIELCAQMIGYKNDSRFLRLHLVEGKCENRLMQGRVIQVFDISKPLPDKMIFLLTFEYEYGGWKQRAKAGLLHLGPRDKPTLSNLHVDAICTQFGERYDKNCFFQKTSEGKIIFADRLVEARRKAALKKLRADPAVSNLDQAVNIGLCTMTLQEMREIGPLDEVVYREWCGRY